MKLTREDALYFIWLAALVIASAVAILTGCHWPGVDNPGHKVHYPPEQWHTPINTNAP